MIHIIVDYAQLTFNMSEYDGSMAMTGENTWEITWDVTYSFEYFSDTESIKWWWNEPDTKYFWLTRTDGTSSPH